MSDSATPQTVAHQAPLTCNPPGTLLLFFQIFMKRFSIYPHIFSTVGVGWEGSDNKLQKVFSPKQHLAPLASAAGSLLGTGRGRWRRSPGRWPPARRGGPKLPESGARPPLDSHNTEPRWEPRGIAGPPQPPCEP